MRKKPTFKDVKFSLIDDITKVWIRATQPISNNSQTETKLKECTGKRKAAVKKTRWRRENTVDESWLMELFHICSCKCPKQRRASALRQSITLM